MLGQKSVAQAFTVDQKAALLAEAKARRSKVIYPALMLALHAGMRDDVGAAGQHPGAAGDHLGAHARRQVRTAHRGCPP